MSVDRLVTRVELQDGVSGPARNVKRSTEDVAKSMDKLLGKQSGDGFRALDTLFPALTAKVSRFATVGTAAMKIFANPVGLGALAVGLTAAAAAFGFLGTTATIAGGAVVGFFQGIQSYAASGLNAFRQSIFFGLAKPFVEARREMEDYERMFTAIMGKRNALQDVRFVTDYAENSALPIRPLMEAMLTTRRLQSQFPSIDTERFVQAIEKLSLSGGPDRERNMQTVLSSLRQIAAGRGAMAFRALGPLGITRDLLEREGVKFDGARLKSTPAEVFDAIQRVTENFRNFSDLLAVNTGSISNVLSTFADAVMLLKSRIGAVVAQFMLPAIEGASKVIKFVQEQGLLDRAVQQVASVFGADDSDAMGRSVAFIVAAVERFSEVWDMATGFLGELWVALEGIFKSAWDQLADILTQFVKAFRDPLIAVVRALGSWRYADALEAVLPTIKADGDLGFSEFGRVVERYRERGYEFGKSLADRADEIMAGANEGRERERPAKLAIGEVTPFGEEDDLGLDQVMGGSSPLVRAIADNTRALLDMRNVVLGGGELARQGVTASDLSEIKASLSEVRAVREALNLASVRGYSRVAVSYPKG